MLPHSSQGKVFALTLQNALNGTLKDFKGELAHAFQKLTEAYAGAVKRVFSLEITSHARRVYCPDL